MMYCSLRGLDFWQKKEVSCINMGQLHMLERETPLVL